ncbi:NUDIX hydrolase [Ancylobacter amanitiformis]|uniref:ADP-ribose pyrophosphatase YjhB (NUDIX family) n=1 Tax=Ancylobacter amanitiformis TaxID=217069 RepID=A0ABU0LQP6_9HYPH|nr:NUDIX hydrolase [Ancylobacter amanitiformis]MDQ0510975.1 ADP-ribose pyrophosphatase YjhB (NUDIX family) [Ancylobacter amanitiformis]
MLPTPERPVLATSAAVFHEGRVLLARRGARPAQGLWTLPGGRVEPGETLADAAARELMEEVGVEAEILGVAGAVDVILRDAQGEVSAHFVVVAHAARWRCGMPTTGPEAAEIGWFEPAALPDGTTEGLPGIVARAALIVQAASHGPGQAPGQASGQASGEVPGDVARQA